MEHQSEWLGPGKFRSQFQYPHPKTPRGDQHVNCPYDSHMSSFQQVMRKDKLMS